MHSQERAISIYVHYPYCLQKCHYCDFFSLPVLESNNADDLKNFEASFLFNIRREWLSRKSDFLPFSSIESIFFGGGTASLLSAEAIGTMIQMFEAEIPFAPDCEITLEGNPENLTTDYLDELSAVKVNRINAGIQTFNRKHLDAMNRYFDQKRYDSIVETLSSRADFQSTGGDLIYGFAGQTTDEFLSDLDRLCKAGLRHLSIYSLTQEPGTRYAAMVRNRIAKPPDDTLQEELFLILPGLLAEKGYRQYEVSNYAVDGYECRHNLRYWKYQPYVGLGPGAHGFDGRFRYGNVRNIERWMQNPLAAKKEEHQIEIDLPLNLFRLMIPFEPAYMADLLNQHGSKRASDVFRFFEKQKRRGNGSFIDDHQFQWTMQGQLQLDTIIEDWVNEK